MRMFVLAQRLWLGMILPAVALFPPPRHPCPPPPLAAQDGDTPAHAAARNGHKAALQALIEAGADVDKATNVSGRGVAWGLVMCVGVFVCVCLCMYGCVLVFSPFCLLV